MSYVFLRQLDWQYSFAMSLVIAGVPCTFHGRICGLYFHLQYFPDLLRRKAGSPRSLLSSRGQYWRSSRQILSPTFSALKMKMVCSVSFCKIHAFHFCMYYVIIKLKYSKMTALTLIRAQRKSQYTY